MRRACGHSTATRVAAAVLCRCDRGQKPEGSQCAGDNQQNFSLHGAAKKKARHIMALLATSNIGCEVRATLFKRSLIPLGPDCIMKLQPRHGPSPCELDQHGSDLLFHLRRRLYRILLGAYLLILANASGF